MFAYRTEKLAIHEDMEILLVHILSVKNTLF